MLTVKQVRFDGAETVDVAERVIYYPSDRADMRGTPTPYAGGAIALVKAGVADEIMFCDGNIYVMNDHGATVAKYDLGFGRDHPAYVGDASGGETPLAA